MTESSHSVELEYKCLHYKYTIAYELPTFVCKLSIFIDCKKNGYVALLNGSQLFIVYLICFPILLPIFPVSSVLGAEQREPLPGDLCQVHCG